MTNEDKVFFRGLIAELADKMDRRFEQVDSRFEQVDSRFEQVDRQFVQVNEQFAQVNEQFAQVNEQFAQVNEQFAQVNRKFKDIHEQLAEHNRQIRHNSMLLELMRDDISHIHERDSFTHERGLQLDALMETMGIDIPALKITASDHSKRIAKLEAKSR